MSKVLCTFPGKHGDSLWAMPTVRAVADAVGEPVDLVMSTNYASILPLYELQPYIGRAFAEPTWQVQDTAPMTPIEPPPAVEYGDYDLVLHLGYRQWPANLLPLEILHIVTSRMEDRDLANKVVGGFTLQKPWIESMPGAKPYYAAVVGFTDEYAELKAGLIWALHNAFGGGDVLTLVPPGGGRLFNAWLQPSLDLEYDAVDWQGTVAWLSCAKVFVGCLSSQAVLAAALGKPRVLVEPNPNRHHPIFQHWDTPLLKGGDGRPTFDSRHMVDEVKRLLGAANG